MHKANWNTARGHELDSIYLTRSKEEHRNSQDDKEDEGVGVCEGSTSGLSSASQPNPISFTFNTEEIYRRLKNKGQKFIYSRVFSD